MGSADGELLGRLLFWSVVVGCGDGSGLSVMRVGKAEGFPVGVVGAGLGSAVWVGPEDGAGESVGSFSRVGAFVDSDGWAVGWSVGLLVG